MTIKLNKLFAGAAGWGRVLEYGNRRLTEEGFENIKVTIRPANKAERILFLKNGFMENDVIVGFFENESKLQVIFLVDKSDVSLSHKITNPEEFVEQFVISMLSLNLLKQFPGAGPV